MSSDNYYWPTWVAAPIPAHLLGEAVEWTGCPDCHPTWSLDEDTSARSGIVHHHPGIEYQVYIFRAQMRHRLRVRHDGACPMGRRMKELMPS